MVRTKSKIMPENNKTEEFLKKIAPCIERVELEKCVEEAARIAEEISISAVELVNLSVNEIDARKYDFAYVLSLAALHDLKGEEKATTFSNAGLAAQSIGKLEKEEEYYKKAIETYPNLAEAHYNYANLFEKLGKKVEAEEHYKKAIEIDPKYAWAHCNYGAFLVELGRKTEAEEHYKKAIELDPKDALAHYNYANLLKELNRKTETEEHYKKAIEIDPKYAWAHCNYGALLVELSRKTEAEEHYKKAIELDPKDALAHYNYANLLIELGRKTEAEEHYKKVIEIDIKNVMAHNDYANLLRKSARFYDAEKEVRTGLQIEPTNPYAIGTLGDILADEGYFEDAKKEYYAAIEVVSKNPASMKNISISEIHNNIGWIYAQLKKYDKAKEEFRKALAHDSMNVRAIRNLRALGKIEIDPEISKAQKYLAGLLSISLIVLVMLFLINKLSETVFALQSIILIVLLIFIVLYHQLAKVKIGTIEFEKDTEYRLIVENHPSELERC